MRLIDVFDLIAKFMYAVNNKWGYIWGTAGDKWTEQLQQSLVNSFVKKYGDNWKNSDAAKKNDKYRGALYGAKWIGHIVADCSGLFKWAFAQLGGRIAHGSNLIYDNYCTSKGAFKNGKRTDGKQLKIGSAVFTGTEKDRGHIGLYIGEGKVIEAQGTSNGVLISKVTLNKWTWWGELKGVRYESSSDQAIDKDVPDEPSQGTSSTSSKPASDGSKPTLRKGDKGSYVTALQIALINRGYNLGRYGADGDFGSMTESAVKQFQQDWDLEVDGVVGPQTWKRLDDLTTTQYVTVHIPHLPQMQAEALLKSYVGSYTTKE